MIKREFNILFSAVLYFTRFSLPFKVPYRKEHQQLILTWFPLIGIIVGGLGAGVFYGFSLILPQPVSVVLALGAMVLITGAFHEDGFADVCDAFGGGYTKDQRLKIMKDSRVGAYALFGVVLLMALKITVLTEINVAVVPLVLIASGSLSRWSTLIISMLWPYARPTGESKSRESTSRLAIPRFVVAFVVGVAPLFLFQEWTIFWSVPIVIVSSLLAGRWFYQRLGGYVGDSLGAVQQLNEVLIMMVVLGSQFSV